MDHEPTQPCQPRISSIYDVRHILSTNLRLPLELTNQILDHACYWPSIVTPSQWPLPLTTYASTNMLTTPPLGYPYGTKSGKRLSGKTEEMVPGMRAERPCREIRIAFQAQSVQRRKEETCCPSGSESIGWENWSSGPRPFEVNLLKEKKIGQGKIISVHDMLEPKAFDSNKTVDQEQPETEAVAVIEEPLGSENVAAREVVWRWTDEGPGGDMVRGMRAGDKVELRTNLPIFGWGLKLWKVQVELYFAI